MNWNNNDTKYILKRVIVYFVIASILFFAGQRCAKALTQSEYLYDPSLNMNITIPNGSRNVSYRITNAVGNYYTAFKNYGEGYVVFTFQTTQSNNATSQLKAVQIGNSTDFYTCELGTTIVYNDSTAQKTIYTAKCHVNFNNNKGATTLVFNRASSSGDLNIWISELGTFVSDSNGADSIISANNNAVQSQINAIANESANLQNVITQSTQQEINAINNQTTAINDNTQAINDLTDTINANYNTSTGTDYLDVFDNIFTQEDENVIRQFVMIPFNLYILLYNAITSGSCQSITLGALYGVNLDLPCINLRQILGVPLYTAIDTIFGACLLFGIVRMIKKFFNSLFSLSSKATDECGIEVFK